MPIPKPMHCVAKAYFLFSLLNISAAFPVILAPVAPRGCPRDIAPPSRFTLLILMFNLLLIYFFNFGDLIRHKLSGSGIRSLSPVPNSNFNFKF